MAYDRAVAITLTYSNITDPRTCVLLVTASWVVGNANAPIPCCSWLSFCGNQEVANFYCDIASLLKLSCSDIHFNEDDVPGSWCFLWYDYYASSSLMFRSFPQSYGFHPPKVCKAFSTCGPCSCFSVLWDSHRHVLQPLTSYNLKCCDNCDVYRSDPNVKSFHLYKNGFLKAALENSSAETSSHPI